METRVFLIVFVLVLASARADMTMEQGMNYLVQFGYMDPPSMLPVQLQTEAMTNAIAMFQEFANINVTGVMDNDTVRMMEMPRCGVRDRMGNNSREMARRHRRYAHQGSRWRVRDLTYRITKYPRLLTQNDVDKEIESAFKVWENTCNLKFNRVTSGKVHIEIRFERGEHGDGDPFDGPGGTLAHAYFPIYGGDAHFDDTEAWTVKSFRGTNLLQVAAHEFGHSLGLSHSDVRSALMAPFYRGYVRNFKLDQDDIKGIQTLYGKKQAGGTSNTPSQKPVTNVPDICRSELDTIIVDSVTKTANAFKGSYVWKLTDNGVEKGYPKPISDVWEGLPWDLDAAFVWTNGKHYFFKGDQYWRYGDLEMDTGYPRLISKGFAGIPDNVDAAFLWSGNGKIYFTKGKDYYRFDPSKSPPVSGSYPKPLATWEGLPGNGIDAALQYSNGYTYFFKGGQYWRFNDRLFRVDTDDPPYPRSTAKWWFGGCMDNMVQMEETKFDPDLSQANRGVNVAPRIVLHSLLSMLAAKLLLF